MSYCIDIKSDSFKHLLKNSGYNMNELSTYIKMWHKEYSKDPDSFPTINELKYFINEVNETKEEEINKKEIRKSSSISQENWNKDSPKQNPNTAYVFTENLQARISSFGLEKNTEIPNTNVKLNVTTTNNLAGIRTDSKGVINNNAIGIITKKYQQNSKGVFVIDEGMFKDTDSDFELFKNSNVEVFKELDKFDSKIFPIGFATGKAKLPTRFALWLQTELLNRYGLVTELNSSKTGLISKSITQNKSQKYPIQSNAIKFNSKTPKFNWLSNFEKLENPIEDRFGNKYWSVEAFYQAVKTNDKKEKLKFTATNLSGAEAKVLGRTVTLREDWDSVKEDVMKEGIKQKFENNPDLLVKLKNTTLQLVEDTNDTFWGVNSDGVGRNILGEILMSFRDNNKPLVKPVLRTSSNTLIENKVKTPTTQKTYGLSESEIIKEILVVNEDLEGVNPIFVQRFLGIGQSFTPNFYKSRILVQKINNYKPVDYPVLLGVLKETLKIKIIGEQESINDEELAELYVVEQYIQFLQGAEPTNKMLLTYFPQIKKVIEYTGKPKTLLALENQADIKHTANQIHSSLRSISGVSESNLNFTTAQIEELFGTLGHFIFNQMNTLEAKDEVNTTDTPFDVRNKLDRLDTKSIFSQFVNFLLARHKELKEKNDLLNANKIANLINNSEELFAKCLIQFKNKGYKLVADKLKDEEEFGEKDFSKNQLQIDPKDNAVGWVKSFLEYIPSGELGEEYGFRTMLPFDRTYAQLRDVLANTVAPDNNLGELMLNKLKDNSENHPDFIQVLAKLQELPLALQNKFFSAMALSSISYVKSVVDHTKGTFEVLGGDSFTHKNNLLDSWANSLKGTSTNSDGVVKPELIAKIEALKKEIESYSDLPGHPLNKKGMGKVGEEKYDVEEEIKTYINKLSKVFHSFGLPLTYEDLRYEWDSLPPSQRAIYFTGFAYKYVLGILGSPTSKYINPRTNKPYESSLLDVTTWEGRDNIVNQNKFLKQVAENKAKKDMSSSGAMIIGPDGKQYFPFSQNNFISDTFTELMEGDGKLDELLASDYHKHSQWLQLLKKLTPEQRKEKFKLVVFLANQYNDVEGDKGTGVTDLEEVDFHLDSIAKSFTGKDSSESVRGFLTPSDKNIYMQMKGFYTETKSYADYVDQHLYPYFLAEFDRVANSEAADYANYSKARKKFYNYPSFNKGGVNATKLDLYDDEGNLYPITKESEKEIKKVLEEIIRKRVDKTTMELRRLGLVETVKTPKRINGVSVLVDEEMILGLSKIGINRYGQAHYDTLLERQVANYVMETQVSNIEYTMLFLGDPAFYKDLPKRAFAPGVAGNSTIVDQAKPTFNLGFANKEPTTLSEKQVTEYAKLFQKRYNITMAEATKMAESYNQGERADASGLCTLDEYFSKLKQLSKWDDDIEVIAEKFKRGEDISYKDFVSLQPLKGVHFQLKKIGNVMVPVYLKYSLFPLIPSVVKGTKLENTLAQMTEAKVDQLVYISGVKTGSLPGISMQDSFNNEAILFETINLDNRYWRLQQDLSPHYSKEGATKEASQSQRNILANIDLELENYTLNGQKVTGQVIADTINNLSMELSQRGTDELLEKLGVEGTNLSLEGESKLYEYLITELSGKVTDNVITLLRNRVPLSSLPGLTTLIEQKLMAKFNSASIHTKMNGGAFIQIPEFGFQNKEKKSLEELNEIHGIKWFVSDGELKPPRVENKEFKGGQVLLPFNVIKGIPNYKSLNGKQLKEILGDSLQDIVGYRIPNQNMSSIDDLEVVGILPEHMGDSIVVYNGLTVKTGSDFDIDKMYIMMKEAKYNPYTKKVETNKFLGEDVSVEQRHFTFYEETIRKLYKEDFEAEKELIEYNENTFKQITAIKESIDNYIKTIGKSFINSEVHNSLKEKIADLHLQFITPLKYTELIQLAYNKALETGEIENVEAFSKKNIYQQNTSKALKNFKLEAYNSILKSEKGFAEKVTPLDGEDLRYDAYYINILERFGESQAETFKNMDSKSKNDFISKINSYEDLEEFSPIAQVKLKTQNAAGRVGIGQTANHVTHHPICQLAGLTFSYNIGIGLLNENDQTRLDAEFDQEGKLITGNLGMFFNGYVDNAKDPYLSLINNNTTTAPIVFLLLRVGVPLRKVNRLVSQPIIKELIKRVNAGKSKALRKNQSKLIKEMLEEFPTEDSFDLEKLTTEDLEEMLLRDDTDEQAKILKAFMGLRKLATTLNDLTKNCKTNVNGGGTSLMESEIIKRKREQILASGEFINVDKLFLNTPLEVFSNNTLYLTNRVLKNMLLEATPGFTNTVMGTLEALRMSVTEENAQLVSKALKTYLYSNSKLFKLSDQAREEVIGQLPDDIIAFKLAFGDKFKFPHLLHKKEKESSDVQIGNIMYPTVQGLTFGFDTNDTNNIINEVKVLWNENKKLSNGVPFRIFLVKLLNYDMLISGFHPRASSICNFIPGEILMELGHVSNVRNMQSLLQFKLGVDTNFINQFARNNISKVPYVNIEKTKKGFVANKTYPYIQSKGVLYALTEVEENVDGTFQGIYKFVPQLAKSSKDGKIVINQYSYEEAIKGMGVKAIDNTPSYGALTLSSTVTKGLSVVKVNAEFDKIKISDFEQFNFAIKEVEFIEGKRYSLYLSDGNSDINMSNNYFYETKEEALEQGVLEMSTVPLAVLETICNKKC